MLGVRWVIGLLALLTVLSQVGLLFLLGLLWLGRARSAIKYLQRLALPLAFWVALMATSGSLFLSEVANFPPCKLCWWQRGLMYPQVALLAVAWLKNLLGKVKVYILGLSLTGVMISVYQYYLQRFAISGCTLTGKVDCSTEYLRYLGYVTVPVMSLTAFLLILVLTQLADKDES